MAEDDLERLAAEGRAITDRARAEAEREKRGAARGAQRAADRVRAASLSSFAGWGWILAGAVLGVSLAAGAAPFLPPTWSVSGADSDPASLVLLILGALPFGALWLLRPTFGARAIAAERARLETLPFPVTGYIEALGRDPRDATVRISLEFAEGEPPASMVGDVFRTIGGQLGASTSARTLSVHRDFAFEGSITTNAYVVGWVRRALPLIVALHARHPLARVRVAVD